MHWPLQLSSPKIEGASMKHGTQLFILFTHIQAYDFMKFYKQGCKSIIYHVFN